MDLSPFRFSLVILALLFQQFSAIKLDATQGSNWYVPSNNGAAVASVNARDSSQAYYHNAAFNNHESERQSSLQPSTATGGVSQVYPGSVNSAAADYSNYYYNQVPSSVNEIGKQHHPTQIYQYAHSPDGTSYTVQSADGLEQRQEFGDAGGGLLSSFGGVADGLGGAASGIASAIGLGGLGTAGAVLVALLAVPLIVLFILFPILILVIGILGFPVLQLTLPPTDPNLARKFKVGIMDTARKAKEVILSEECIERLSCTLARKSRKLPYESWILGKMTDASNTFANRISKSIKTGRSGETCEQFTCSPVLRLNKLYNTVISSTKITTLTNKKAH